MYVLRPRGFNKALFGGVELEKSPFNIRWLLFLILPAHADQMGPIGSEAKLDGGTEFGQAHSYTIDWANPTWALDNLISFIFKPSQTVALAYSFTTPHQPSYLKATLHANPVPEPSNVILFGTGLIGLAGWGRSRFKKS
jgi:hypothetical protein